MRQPGPDWVEYGDVPESVQQYHKWCADGGDFEPDDWYLVEQDKDGWWVVAVAGGPSGHYYVGAESFSFREIMGVAEVMSASSTDVPEPKRLADVDTIARDQMRRCRDRFNERLYTP